MRLVIRTETAADHRAVEELTREAFWDVHNPGCDEHYLAHILRDAACFIPELDLVALADNRLVGNIMYTIGRVLDLSGTSHPVLSFGPLSVHPAYQGKGIGRALVQGSLEIAAGLGHGAVLIYGDPAYYSRLGFVAAEDYGIRGQYGMFSPALQVLELIPGYLKDKAGTFWEDEAYHLDPTAAARFDLNFPPREKGFKPSQQRFQELLALSHP